MDVLTVIIVWWMLICTLGNIAYKNTVITALCSFALGIALAKLLFELGWLPWEVLL